MMEDQLCEYDEQSEKVQKTKKKASKPAKSYGSENSNRIHPFEKTSTMHLDEDMEEDEILQREIGGGAS